MPDEPQMGELVPIPERLSPKRRLFYSTDHDIHWPVGGAAIVIASDEREARSLLQDALWKEKLDPNKPFTLHEVDLTLSQALILANGEY